MLTPVSSRNPFGREWRRDALQSVAALWILALLSTTAYAQDCSELSEPPRLGDWVEYQQTSAPSGSTGLVARNAIVATEIRDGAQYFRLENEMRQTIGTQIMLMLVPADSYQPDALVELVIRDSPAKKADENVIRTIRETGPSKILWDY
jgi:hypothetical protein